MIDINHSMMAKINYTCQKKPWLCGVNYNSLPKDTLDILVLVMMLGQLQFEIYRI
jgi:hypothetical protein